MATQMRLFYCRVLKYFLLLLHIQFLSEPFNMTALTQGFPQGAVLGRTLFTYTGTVSQAPWPLAKWFVVVCSNHYGQRSGSVVCHCVYTCMSLAVINKRAWTVYGMGHCERHLYLLPFPYPNHHLLTCCNEDMRLFIWLLIFRFCFVLRSICVLCIARPH